MNEYQYSLEKYSGSASRHECPRCRDKHSFVLYVDASGQPLDERVGRCNHEDGCGYHYTPKEFFIDNPSRQERIHQRTATPGRTAGRTATPGLKQQEPDYLPFSYVEKSASFNSDFVHFLCGILSEAEIERAVEDYAIGATKGGDVIFWQIDMNGRVRTGKIMKYDKDTGHRCKAVGGITWVHSVLIKQGRLKDFNLRQCLFGEHLLKVYPNRPVALVESEKSALIGAAIFHKYTWMACGGKSNLNADKMRVLRGKQVVLFPDTGGGYEDWCRRAKDIEAVGCRVSVSDILERHATDEEKAKGIDIADWLIKQLTASRAKAEDFSVPVLSEAERTLQTMIEKNHAVQTLIDTFDLKLI